MLTVKRLMQLLVAIAILSACTAPSADEPTQLPTNPVPSVTATAPPTSAPSPTPAPTATTPPPAGLQPGESVGEVTLTQAQDETEAANLIWDYCSPNVGDQAGQSDTKLCTVPQFADMFIGNGIYVDAIERLEGEWSSLAWELYVDEQPVDLAAFGTVDVWGGNYRLWNVLLSELPLGEHTIRYSIAPAATLLARVETTWRVTVAPLSEFPELTNLPPQPTPLPAVSQPVKRGSADLPWWNDHVFYEVFVRSFKDSDGDGIGDIPGLISMLDYLNDGDPTTTSDLGVTGIWLMPVAQSPSYHGYDVVDYKQIEADYGTNEDFKLLMEAAHQRGIVVIVDLVMNHTSNEHPWFVASSEPDSPYRTWYIWDDTPIPYASPWGSNVWHARNESYYYGLFWEGMPDLNYRNGDVTLAMRDIIKFWLEDMAVDGFRLDAVRHLIEVGGVQENTPETHAWLEDFYRYVHSVAPDALTVGEVWDESAEVVQYIGDEVDIAFEFDLAGAILDSVRSGENGRLSAVQSNLLEVYASGQYATFLTNHDQNRVINVLQKNLPGAKVAATLLLTSAGVPFIYYGEEIGMRGVKPDEDIRKPMQWESTAPGGGFTTGTPWRVLNNDLATVNVAAESSDPDSLLSHYRSLIHLRNAHPALRTGETLLVESSSAQVFAFVRVQGTEAVLVVVNLGETPVSDYALSLAAGGLSAVQPVLLFGAGDLAAPQINASGGFDGYQPLPELPAYTSLVIQLAP